MTEEDEAAILARVSEPNATHYDVLGVTNDASYAAITKSYRLLALRFHPDTYRGSDKPAAQIAFQRFSFAAEVLRDSEKRKAYDDSLAKPPSQRCEAAESPQYAAAGPTQYHHPMANLFSANVYYLKDMLIMLREDPDADMSPYKSVIVATACAASVDFVSFLISNPIFLLPLGLLTVFVFTRSEAKRKRMVRRALEGEVWNNFTPEMKIQLIEFLVSYSEKRLADFLNS